MPRLHLGVWTFAVGLVASGTGGACAQEYPIKPIRIVCGSAGGASDFASRQIAQGTSGPLGQPMIVDNRVNTGEIVAKAPADGYTLLFDGASFWISPFLQATPYDPVKDFSPITLAVSSPNILVVHPSVAATNIKEFIALAKSKPGALNYGSSPTGSTSHLAAESFKTMAGLNIVRVNYKGVGPAIIAVTAGEVQMMFANSIASIPLIKAGKLRALAIASPKPSALMPGLPTLTASGVPGFESVSLQGVFAPAKTPAAAIRRLNQEIVRTLDKADVKERLLNAGMEAVGTSPEEFVAAIKSDMERWGKVIKHAGIRVE